MDIKVKVEEIVGKLKNDPKMLQEFTSKPVPVVEKLIGVDLPDDQIQKIADLVKAKVDLDKAGELLGGLGSLFKK